LLRAIVSYEALLYTDLPSFPTRRSSDLTDSSTWIEMNNPFDLPQGLCSRRHFLGASAFSLGSTALAWLNALAPRKWRREQRPWGDRKSTRLNSSHEWISYAVFCLKKKTQ